jgi:hypothetical protein
MGIAAAHKRKRKEWQKSGLGGAERPNLKVLVRMCCDSLIKFLLIVQLDWNDIQVRD